MRSIPQTDALLETTLESLQEIYSLDPERWQESHVEKIVHEMRILRERFDEAEKFGRKSPRSPKFTEPGKPVRMTKRAEKMAHLRALLGAKP